MPESPDERQSRPAPLCAATSEAVPGMEAEQPQDQAQIAASAAAHTEQNTQAAGILETLGYK